MHVYEILWNFLLFYPKNISTIILTKLYFIQNILQDLCFFVLVSGPIITILMASSKTAFRPFWLSAEHSRYFWMWIVGFLDCRVLTRLLAYKYSTCLNLIKNSLLQMTSVTDTISWFLSLSFWISPGSSLMSALVPTRMIGVSGQWWVTSGIHLELTLSKLVGLVMAKQTRNTSFKSQVRQVITRVKTFVTYSLRIWQWSESVIVILTCCIP